ncbi:hypothetical protein [Limisphaera sp. VF-2]|jgi:hypothetical protein|uniref:hypothetical protein n=1 Tax=Limisphaera sp. VF-2 TaxID=3400418 RepID=UPI00174FC313|nr:hypothetical protein [Limisphaera sp.]
MRLVTIATLLNPAEAHLLRSRLETAGFHPQVVHEDAALSLGGYALAAGGILVQVPESEAHEVRQFLRTATPGPDEPGSA